MTRNFTHDRLIKYLYEETSITERLEIENEMDNDFELREQYEMLVQAQDSLPTISFAPPKSVVDNILNFSKISEPEVSL